ncbi:hypothetical protein [Shimia sp.]|uniref:hypothetical protein n=1 Tax=Shimia sp. TaxID=1954381 RepID=UPI0032980C70
MHANTTPIRRGVELGRKPKKHKSDTSRFFVMNELKTVQFVSEDEIQSLQSHLLDDLRELINSRGSHSAVSSTRQKSNLTISELEEN